MTECGVFIEEPAPRYCDEKWEDIWGIVHLCYLEFDHRGEHLCGNCYQGMPHDGE